MGLMSSTEALGEGGDGGEDDELGFRSGFELEPGDAVDVEEKEEEDDEDGPRMLRVRRLGAMVGRSGIVRYLWLMVVIFMKAL